MLVRTIVLSFLLLVIAEARAAGLPHALATAFSVAGVAPHHAGLVIQDLDAARPQVTLNARTPFNPASAMKVLTTLATLDTFGPAHHFQTHILLEGTLSEGTLTGNLIIQGGGDPALNLEHFRTLLGEIRARGVRRIEGDVVLDNSLYAIEPTDPGAFDDEPLKPYNALPSALLVNYNALPLHLSAINGQVIALIDPPTLTIQNALHPSDGGACDDWEDGLSVSRTGTRLNLSGYYPAACGDRTLWLSLLPSVDTAASVFRAYWTELGGVLTGQIRQGSTPTDATSLFDFDSPQLAEIVRDTNKYSNNVMAKMLFLDLGAARYGAPATWDKSRKAIQDWLRDKKLDMPELVIENGSGLSRVARISAASMARLLVWASRQPLYYEFAASLPALGLEGTQRHRMKDTPQSGRAWLKSGSLEGVRNLAGYVLDQKGHRKVVILFINGTTGRQAEAIQQTVLKWAIGDNH